MRILFNRDLKHATARVVRSVYAFIGVDESFSPGTSKRHNTTKYMRLGSMYRTVRAAWQPFKTILNDNQLVGALRDRVRSFFFDREEKPEMNTEDRMYLQKRFEEPNSRLAEWLGRDLSHWT